MPLPLDLDNSSIAGTMAGEFVNAAAAGSSDDDASRQLARLLFWVAFITMLLDLATALYKAPSGVVFSSHKLAYYLTLAAIFAFGMVEVIVAFCLSRYCRSGRVGALARAVLCVSVLPLVAAVALGGFAVVMKS